MKTIYIAGPITNIPNYKANLDKAEQFLKSKGWTVVNPSILPEGFKQEQYMKVCFEMLDWCDTVYFLSGWAKSKGSCQEFEYADARKMNMIFEVTNE